MRSSKWFVLAALLVAVDQLLKAVVVWLRPHSLFLVYVENSGATFGLFAGANDVLAGVSVVALALVAYFLVRSESWADSLGLSLVFAGVAGNFVDRVLRGFVVDFVRLGSFPVFNLADVLIVCGVLLLVLLEVPAVRRRL